jgi:hypothetical protein
MGNLLVVMASTAVGVERVWSAVVLGVCIERVWSAVARKLAA